MIKTTMLTAIALIGLTGVAAAQGMCRFYEDVDFGGRRLIVREGQSRDFVDGEFWNDRISSARISPGCSARVTIDTDGEGDERELEGRVRDLGPEWNDQISSIDCDCD